ncbi:MAG TPA: GNAT family N-acetyltransferase [Methylomirabilota bacterium]|jgi:hypothetical protein
MGGYLHPAYAESLREFGTPRLLAESGGWILERPIPGSARRDAMGCYPFFACRDWSGLRADLERIGGDLVSLALVTDPFGGYTAADLRACFAHVLYPYKEHFIVDLERRPTDFVSDHHRRNATKALGVLEVEACPEPGRFAGEWMALYANLIARHDISGLGAFSSAAFARQLTVPGLVMLRATHRGAVVGITLWYVRDEVAYYHLGAYNDLGYTLRASFALFWRAVELFAGRGSRWIGLGAGPGARGDGQDGLSRFKRGWSTGTRPVYFCGRILDEAAYAEIVGTRRPAADRYFPEYRAGEFR